MKEPPRIWSDAQYALSDPDDERQWGDDSEYPRSVRAAVAFMLGLREDNAYRLGRLDDTPTFLPPRWSSTVGFVDTFLSGGFYGMTTLAGGPGLGKSTLGLASAIEAASSLKWNVLYFDAESGKDELTRRTDQYLAVHPSAEDGIDNMRIVSVPRGFTVEQICENLVAVAGDDRPILTVFDSVNTCAQLMVGDYLNNLRDLVLASMMGRRMSRGNASFLMISELNRQGQAKGTNAEHWSDVVVKLLKERERGWVKMRLQKTRATQGENEERKLVRVHHSSRFLSQDELEQQRARAQAGGAAPSHLHLVGGQDDEDDLDMEW